MLAKKIEGIDAQWIHSLAQQAYYCVLTGARESRIQTAN